jgi:hypothetical protein
VALGHLGHDANLVGDRLGLALLLFFALAGGEDEFAYIPYDK